jgi:tetratricopeptide (TPR) repeat protein
MRTIVVAIVIILASGRALAGPSAEELYDQGQDAYDHGDWPTAIEKWRESYDLSGAAGLLFNLAQAYRLSGDCPNALSGYRRFVELDPKSEQRGLADDFIRELTPSCGVPTQPPTTERAREMPSRALKTWGLVAGGAGALSLVIGVGLGSHASTLGDEVTTACASSCDWQAVKGKDAAGRRDAVVGYTLDAVGIAALAGGAVMYYLGTRTRGFAVSPHAAEGGAVISFGGSW